MLFSFIPAQLCHKKCRRDTAAFDHLQLLAFLAFALLVCDTAAGLASGLAGSLAFAATAVLGAFAQITSFDGLNMFHGVTSIKVFRMYLLMLPHDWHKVNIRRQDSEKFLRFPGKHTPSGID